MKKSINKLNLNKMTISNLDATTLDKMVGGAITKIQTKADCSNPCPATKFLCPSPSFTCGPQSVGCGTIVKQ